MIYLIHLSIKMTMQHQSGAPFLGKQVFQNRGVCGKCSLPRPTTPCFVTFVLSHQCTCSQNAEKPFFVHENACYKGYCFDVSYINSYNT